MKKETDEVRASGPGATTTHALADDDLARPDLLRAANERLVLATLRAQDLAESTVGFKLLVDTVKEYAIFLLDPSGHVRSWNAGAERINGYTADEIIGRHFSVFYPPAEVAAGKCEYELEVAVRDGRFEEEGPRLRKDGSEFLASVVITALTDVSGKLVGFGKVTRDMTDRVRMERDRVARARAEEAERTKDEFLAILGHELRNPLAPMVTAVHLLKLRGGLDSAREIEILERQILHMKRLMDDLLDVSSVRLEKLRLTRAPHEIGEVIANGVDVAAPLITSKGHRLTLDVAARGLMVDVDVARMTQVFANVLNNAAKYTDPRGDIRVRARVEDGDVVVTIEDTGAGIAGELKPRIFDLFAQGGQGLERQLGGLGIGLAIAQRFVVAHGGRITVESDGPGRGSCFTVRLPRVAAPSTSDSAAPPARPRAAVCRRVLLVDDNEDSCEMLQFFLESFGHEARVAHDGPQALALVKSFAPDIVFLDIGLPGMHGYEVVRRMRQMPVCAKIPIVALSGYSSAADRRRALAAGFTDHFAKPVDPAVLAEVVEKAALAG